MRETEKNAFEGVSACFSRAIAEDKLPIVSGLIVGLISAGFAFTNKFVNADELEYLFAKGATISSGRWALALTSFIFPDISMPWIYGVIALALLVAASCIILRLLEIKSPFFRALFPALVVSFPAQSLTYAYRFTCAPYALAVLLIALSAYITLCAKIKYRHIIGAFILAFAFGIYQAYISLAAGLYVVYLIRELVSTSKDWKSVLRLGLKLLAELILALAIYFAINKLVMHFTGTEYNEYALSAGSVGGHLFIGLCAAYMTFLQSVLYRYLQLVPNDFARALHIILLAVSGASGVSFLKRCEDWGKRIMFVTLALIFPISINCVTFLATSPHSLEFLSFVVLYILIIVLTDALAGRWRPMAKDAVALVLVFLSLTNITFANKTYLKQELVYEESYGFYAELVSRVRAMPEYVGTETVCLIGGEAELVYSVPEIYMGNVMAIRDEFVDSYSYSRGKFITNYIGVANSIQDSYAQNAADISAEIYKIYSSMPTYPADGSIREVGDGGAEVILVKLG